MRGRLVSIRYCCFWVLMVASFGAGAQVNVTPALSAAALAQKLAGQGVTILNPVLTCDQYAAGIFRATGSNLGLDSGVVLTTGAATSVGGVASLLASTNNGTPGDPQLAALAGATTHDACKLEFDIIPKEDSLQFEYIFGSEEYNNATCGPYNDAFSFFISGPGISGQVNMALVPGTLVPVAVNSINNGIPGPQGNISNCTSMGAGSPFTTYYVDNLGGSSITYRGFTTVLRAVHAVQPCGNYHLKLTIADAGNSLYDSGVFLKAESIRTDDYTIRSKGSSGAVPPVVVYNCGNATVTIRRSSRHAKAQTVKYLIAGDAVRGSDYTNIADSVVIPANDSSASFIINALKPVIGGKKIIRLYLLEPTICGQPAIIDSTFITLYDAPAVNILTPDTSICVNTGMSVQVQGTEGLVFAWSPATGVSSVGAAQPFFAPLANTTYTVRATLPGSGCPAVSDSFRISLMNGPDAHAGADQQLCAGQDARLIALDTQPSLDYAWTGPAGFNASGTTALIPAAMPANSGAYVLQVSGPDNSCIGLDTVQLYVRAVPPAPHVSTPLELCIHGQVGPLRASGSGLLWYADSTGGAGISTPPVPSVSKTGQTKYYVSAAVDGCESARAGILVEVFNCCGDEIVIPTAFSPNGDRHNDQFGIIAGISGISVDYTIYNRWGEQVFHGVGYEKWDGMQNGKPAPIGTYYYLVRVDCHNGAEQLRKGEVNLIR